MTGMEGESQQILYRISSFTELQNFKTTGLLHGNELDKSSGFIHLSKASQIASTLKKFFQGRPDLYLLSIDAEKLGDGVKYEKVDGVMASDSVFPHFYGPLGEFCPVPIEALLEVHKLELQEGKHILPF
ncbi:hypothetical protein KP509_12G066800 [Ceratopteris richardii]|nr:hypothetical protein KP509_12G066800 [Ceratopteris richardii]